MRGFLGDFALDNSRTSDGCFHAFIITWNVAIETTVAAALFAAKLSLIYPRFAHVHLDDIEVIMNVVTVVNTVRVSIDTRVVILVPSLAGAQYV